MNINVCIPIINSAINILTIIKESGTICQFRIL